MDNRIIDLDLDNPKLPEFFKDLGHPINMTLCAGDGIQDGITNIEWFVTRKKGFSRENKPTTIFITTKNYSPKELEENKKYLKENKDLKVILLIYDHKKPKWKENLIKLLPNSIDNIYEDAAGCYGEILDLETLYRILRENGVYHINHGFFDNNIRIENTINTYIGGLQNYSDYFKYFTINLLDNPYNIIKDSKDKLFLPTEEEYKKGIDHYTKKGLNIVNVLKKKYNIYDHLNYSKRIELDKADSIKRQLWKDSKKGGKKKKTKKSKKTRKNKTRKAKNRRKHYTFSYLKRPL